jgi:3-methylfumaryl-CoA hydratase
MTAPRTVTMLLDHWPVRALEATLGLDERTLCASSLLPPLWHWPYFLPVTPRSGTGVDGHALDAGASEDEPPERRVFASARLRIERPLQLGEPARQSESVIGTRQTQGKSGALRIVTFEYQYFQKDELCIHEERDIIYRQPGADRGVDRATKGASEAAVRPAPVGRDSPAVDCSEEITPDAVMLFRFSALTFNAHRIHYDQGYAQGREGYRERVVHGPLVAILLGELHRKRVPAPLRRFEFRAHRPLFVDEPILLTATTLADHTRLQALDPTGAMAMEADVWC